MKKALTVIAAATMLGGCDGELGLGLGVDANASLSFAAAGSQGLLGRTEPQETMRFGTHTIVVSSADVGVSELELEGDEENFVIRDGSSTVKLKADGTVVTPFTAEITPGRYHTLEMDVNTVRIRGTYDGSPFDVTVNVNEELHIALSRAVEIAEASMTNITVGMVMASWFRASEDR